MDRRNLLGYIFGRWKVVDFCEPICNKKGTKIYVWKCKCLSCGLIKNVRENNLLYGISKSCRQCGGVKDLTGKKFGKLTIISKVENTYGGTVWLCQCECGNKKNITSKDLIHGYAKACGCLRGKNKNPRLKDLTGKVFGKLTVLYRDVDIKRRGRTDVQWVCQCSCGNQKSIVSYSLFDGSTKSCGCLETSKAYIASRLKEYFKNNYKAVSEYKGPKNPKTGRYLRYDIFLPESNTFIEINGIQHYKFVEYFYKTHENYVYRKSLDKLKIDFAKKQGTYIEVDLRKSRTVEEAITYIEQRL